MAVEKNGFLHGKVGGVVSYPLNGVLVTRGIGINNNPPTLRQLGVQQRTRVVNDFLKRVSEFTSVGFELKAKKTNKRTYALAFGYNWGFGLKGAYPDIQIDFEHVRLAEGQLPIVADFGLAVEEQGLRYNWNPDATIQGAHWSDQVMMLAYFPALQKAFYCTAGASRINGTDLLPIHYEHNDLVAETYLAFISNDRKRISNSVYTGQITW
ncbi:DUF6266 family protein [Pedobacter gandavensis]|uniref:DUF6266 family protein n=1 Tax=Pedobacter gandavensis TaxID=2679963 RepID=UPI002930A51B|nr:DUF6266 family protein [Pedobacter gandavensis]